MSSPAAAEDTAERRDPFAAAFPAFIAPRRASEPAWLVHLRENAFARAAELGLPTRADEDWKYTNLQAVAALRLQEPPHAAAAAARAAAEARALGSHRAVLVNGRFVAAASALSSLPDGLAVAGLAERFAREPAEVRRLLEDAELDPAAGTTFASLATAFFSDGVAIDVAAGARRAGLLHVLHLAAAGGAPYAAFPRLFVCLGRGAELTLVEEWCSARDGAAVHAPAIDVLLEEGAILRHVRVVDESSETFHFASTRVRARRDARYASVVVAFGGRIGRHDLTVRLLGEGAHADLDGLYQIGGTEVADQHTLVEHAVPHTSSRQHYKGVLSGKAQGTFTGRIVVRPGAQKTSAEQANHNLILSADALANSTPQLEIFADDVQCRHGSTIGQIDPQQLFYLRTRGLGPREALELLTYAFSHEIVERVPSEALRDRIEARLAALGARGTP